MRPSLLGSSPTSILGPDGTIFLGTQSLTGRLQVLTAAMFAFFERTLHWFELLGDELVQVPTGTAQAAFWDSIRQLYEQALAGSDDDLLTKTTAGLLRATFWCTQNGRHVGRRGGRRCC